MGTKDLIGLSHVRNKDEVSAVKHGYALQKFFFTDRSKAVILLWILYVICVSCPNTFSWVKDAGCAPKITDRYIYIVNVFKWGRMERSLFFL